MLEAHLAVGWQYQVDVVIDAAFDTVAPCVSRAIGRLEPIDATTCRLTGTTSNPFWYAEQLVALPAAYHIVGGPELRDTARRLGQRLVAAAEAASAPATV